MSKEAVERCGNWIAHNASPTGIDRWNKAIDALSARLAEVEAERDRQYDENVDRIAQQAAAEARAEAAEASLLATCQREAATILRWESRLEAAEAERDALQAKLAVAVTCLQRITWVLDDERGAMEATALAYANTTLATLDAETTPAPEVSVGDDRTLIVKQVAKMPVRDVDWGEIKLTENWGRIFIERNGTRVIVFDRFYDDFIAAFQRLAALRALAGDTDHD